MATFLVASLVSVFASTLAATVAAILNAFIARRTAKTLKSNERRLETIHVLVNGRLSEALSQHADALIEIAELRGEIAGLTGDHQAKTEADAASIKAAKAVTDQPNQ